MWFLTVLFSFQMVDLNQASLEQLMTVEGVGHKMAERILDYRQENGVFSSLEDLLLIQGIKPKHLDKMRSQVILGKRNKAASSKNASTVISDEEAENLLQNFSDEPGVRQVQEEALKYANAHPEQIRSAIVRAQKSHWLPQLHTGMDPQLGHWDLLREKTGDPEIFSNRKSMDWRFHVKAEWHLNNLIFNRDEIMLGQQFLRQSLMRERILGRVNEAYFERRRLQIQKRNQAFNSTQAKLEAFLRIQELTAELDGLTGAWFSSKKAYSF